MTAIEDAHARAAERSRWKPVRAAWAAIHATAWNDGIEPGRDRDITKPQWALAYAQRLKQFAETACAAGLVSRINLMQNPAGILFSPKLRKMVFSNLPQFWKEESGAALGERVAWELVKMALTEEANLLAETIENLPDECEWKTTFENELPRVFVTGVIEPKIWATTPSNYYVADLRSKAVSKIESEVWDDIERELIGLLTVKQRSLFAPLWKHRNTAVKWQELGNAYTGSTGVRAIQEALKEIRKRLALSKSARVNVTSPPSTVTDHAIVMMTVEPCTQRRAEK